MAGRVHADARARLGRSTSDFRKGTQHAIADQHRAEGKHVPRSHADQLRGCQFIGTVDLHVPVVKQSQHIQRRISGGICFDRRVHQNLSVADHHTHRIAR
ncbi:hypothetical protein SDC9_199731 [bioreactor metagenome]|uniref:Uncharacterized protein n=1 Tax=bioreactor metagenome TaxID=1076179 RepID=A0A645ILD8_9ZZZZ